MKQYLLLVFLFFGFVGEGLSQTGVSPDRKFEDLHVNQAEQRLFFKLYSDHFDGRHYAYFRFNALPNETTLTYLKEKDIRLLEYIPGNIYLLSVPSESWLDIYGNSFIVSSVLFHNQKFSDQLLKALPANLSSSTTVNIYAYAYDDISAEKLKRLAQSFGTIITASETFHRISIAVPLNKIKALSELQCLKIMDLAPPTPVADNLPGKSNHRSSVIGSGFGRNLQGDSVVLGEWDGEGAGTHVDIDSPRVIRMHPYVNNSNGQHATHVAGTMAGAGIIDPYATGMAPNAKVFSWNFYGDITAQMDSGVRFQKVMITQNSYGYGDSYDTCKYRGRYDDVSRELDILVRNHTNLVHVFAAGNSQSWCGLGGFRTVFSGFQSAKNIISVGALTDQDAMSSFSSWGPVRDGRLKPEVCAVGVNVYSTLNNNLYAGGWNGTSMACPGASGTMAQLVQRYHQLNAGAEPQASLMRAVFANTADDIMNAGPDFKSGFGRINGLTAVKAIEQKRYMVDSVSTSAVKMDSIFVSGGAFKLKVTLAWSDKEAAILANKALVNDLDLFVITPLGDTIRPWVLDTMNRNALAVRGIDSVNNIEQVTIDTPIVGYYKILVRGRSVPFGPQVYSYAYERVAKAITVVYPNGGELLAPSKTYSIKWDANGVGNTCNIEYSLNNGASWSTMVNNIATSLKNYNWGTPNTNTSLARIRITAGAYSDLSDTTFSILNVVDTIKGVVCDKQVTLKWKKITGVTVYDVMQLINGSMVSVGTTIDTFYTVKNLVNNVKYWFTIRGKYNNMYGERAKAVTFTPNSALLPPVVTLQPVVTPVCSGTMITLKAKATGTVSILQQWQFSTDTGKTFISVPFATDTVFSFMAITAMNNLRIRCFFYNTCQSFQYSDTLVLLVDTSLLFMEQPQDLAVCLGNDAVFSASAPSNSGTTYQWQFNDGINGWQDVTGETTTTITIGGPTTTMDGWQYRLVASNQCFTNIISNSARLTVRGPIDVTATGGKTICWGTGALLGANATGGDTSRYVFEWSLNGTVIQRSHSPFLSVAPIVSRTYKVTLWDSCSAVSYTDSDTVTINVLQSLLVAANSFVPLCKGQSTTLAAAGAGGTGNYTYGWLNGTTLLQYSKSGTLTVSPSITTVYRVFVTDSCTPKKDTATITVSVKPPLNVTRQSNPDTVCIGAQALITATGSGGDSSYVYTFINATTNTILQSGLSNSLLTSVAANNNFIVVLSDSCTVLNDTLRFKVPTRSKLTVSLTKSPLTEVCSNSPVTLTANPGGGALKNYTYQWRMSGSSVVIGTTKQITINAAFTTRYTVTIGDGCTTLGASDSIMVYVDAPNPYFSNTYSNGLDYAFFTPSQSGYRGYFWSFGDGDTTSEFQPNHQYKKKGSYAVCLKVTTFNNCDSTYCDTVDIYFNNGINGTLEKGFTCAPNPFRNELYLNFENEVPSLVLMIDATGRETAMHTPLYSRTTLHTGELAPGTYILKLVFRDRVSFIKLIKE